MATVQLSTYSPDETFGLGRDLGQRLRGGEVVALVGDLGSGKTTFTRGLACGLGFADYRKVNSPTYVLEQIYEGRCLLHHYDAYRLAGEAELRALGFDERLGGTAVLVLEWADRVAGCLPDERLLVEIGFASETGPDARRIRLTGSSSRWSSTLSALVEPRHGDDC